MRIFYATMLGGMVAIAAFPFLEIAVILAEVKSLSKGRPYCIEISGDHPSWYRQLGSLLELNGWSLRAPFVNTGGSGSNGFVQLTFHALLVVKINSDFEWRNWSYWHQHFDELSPEQLRAVNIYSPDCNLQKEFKAPIPFFAPSEAR
jgi:hypothetical protein